MSKECDTQLYAKGVGEGGVSVMHCVNAIMQLYASLFECLTCHLHMKDLMAFALNWNCIVDGTCQRGEVGEGVLDMGGEALKAEQQA